MRVIDPNQLVCLGGVQLRTIQQALHAAEKAKAAIPPDSMSRLAVLDSLEQTVGKALAIINPLMK